MYDRRVQSFSFNFLSEKGKGDNTVCDNATRSRIDSGRNGRNGGRRSLRDAREKLLWKISPEAVHSQAGERISPSVSPLVSGEVIACGIDFLRGPPQCSLSIIRYQPRLLELNVNVDVKEYFTTLSLEHSTFLGKCFPFPKDAGSIHLSFSLCSVGQFIKSFR